MSLGSTLIKTGVKQAADSYDLATLQPAETQRRKLLSIVKKNEHTEYGRRYGFSSIRTISQYQRQVPVTKYEDIRNDVERMVAGEKNILTAETPVMFTLTSGTTGKPKYIAVTPTCRNHEHSNILKTWVYHVMSAHPEIWNGKIVSLASPAIEGYTQSGIPFGSASGSVYRDIPAILRAKYAVCRQVFEISDYQAKYYTIMRLVLEQDVSLICTANPSSILKMCEKAHQFSEQIIQDIRAGTLSRTFEIEPQIRAYLEKRLTPSPDRSGFLEKARAKRKGILKPADYWPSLCLIACWKGGTVGHYVEKFPQWFNPDGNRKIPVRDWGYLSSEGRCSIPVCDEGSAGFLAVAANFYEFVPVGDLMDDPEQPASWTFLTTEQLQDGKEYYIFITTTGGLYRYDINDIVRVEGYYNKTPQIVFVRKGRDMTNITGEKLSVDQAIEAIQCAGRQSGVIPSHFKVEADIDNSRYILRVELPNHISEGKGRAFLVSFDEYLKHVNIEYKCKRDSMRLDSPVLHVMREGWYESAQRQLVENGRRAFQTKLQVLSPVKSDAIEIKSQMECVIEM